MDQATTEVVQFKKLIHILQVAVRWGDMDAMGHVNNTLYFRYFEQARISWFDSIGAPSHRDRQGFILVAAACNFRVPIVYPDTLEVRTYSRPPGRSSLPLYQEIWSLTKPSVLYAEGDSTVAWVDFHINKSIALPDSLRSLVTSG